MQNAPTGKSAHIDSFTRDNLPAPDLWPDMEFTTLPNSYAAQTNCATELLDKKQPEFGGRPVIYHDDVVWTYADLQANANRIANVLVSDLGLVPGNRVLLRAPNSRMMAACWFGVIKAGGVVVATMPMLRWRELAYVAEKAAVDLALCDTRLTDELIQAQKESGRLGRIVSFGTDADDGLEANMDRHEPEFRNVDTAADDVCLIAFTSGTTGQPKGTMHFHRDIMAACDCFPLSTLKAGADDIFTGSPPLAFTFGLGGLLLFPMHVGASTVLVEAPSPDNLLATIQKFKVTTMFTAPTAYRTILSASADYDISSLDKCVSAGEKLPLPIWQDWFDTTGTKIIDGLGSTEMLHIFVSAAGDEIRPGATGKAIAGYEACVMDDEGSPMPVGEVGRLAVRGPTGCRYLADERQKTYVADGWNYTGDAYLMDEDGYFWFQARTDDMIVSAGYNISGPEVEEALLAHKAVQECAVVASLDEARGNIVKAFVVLADGAVGDNKLATSLQKFVKQRIAPYKYPRAIEYIDALPRTETGKVQRFRLRQQEES